MSPRVYIPMGSVLATRIGLTTTGAMKNEPSGKTAWQQRKMRLGSSSGSRSRPSAALGPGGCGVERAIARFSARGASPEISVCSTRRGLWAAAWRAATAAAWRETAGGRKEAGHLDGARQIFLSLAVGAQGALRLARAGTQAALKRLALTTFPGRGAASVRCRVENR